MKKLLCLLVLSIVCARSASAFVNYREAKFEHTDTNAITYLDYIETDVMPDVVGLGLGLHFAVGNINLFTNNSLYFYLYQIENHLSIDRPISHFAMSVSSDEIVTGGYFTSPLVDLDLAPFNHNSIGDHEVIAGSNPLIAPSNADLLFDVVFIWEFSPEILTGDESTILFLTTHGPLSNVHAEMIYIDYPMVSTLHTVPEPSAMLLFGLGSAWFIRKRFAKK